MNRLPIELQLQAKQLHIEIMIELLIIWIKFWNRSQRLHLLRQQSKKNKIFVLFLLSKANGKQFPQIPINDFSPKRQFGKFPLFLSL